MKQNKHPVMRSPWLRRLVLVVLSVMLGGSLYTLNARSLTGNQMPMPFGTGLAVVLSGSMEPTLHVNDVLVVRQRPDYQVGDVVVYQTGRELIVHRVVSADETTYLTQGDANNVADAPIAHSAVKGKVVVSIPLLGIVVNGLKTPVGMLLTFGCALALIEVSFRREKERNDQDLEAIKEEIRRLKEQQAQP